LFIAAEFNDREYEGQQQAITHKYLVHTHLTTLAEYLLLLMDGAFTVGRLYRPGESTVYIVKVAEILLKAARTAHQGCTF